MPVATANGKKFTFPEGTTPEQMGQAIDEYFSSQQPTQAKGIDPDVPVIGAQQEQPQKPEEAGIVDRMQAGMAGFNRGVINLAGLPMDTAANVVDLGKAAIGSGYIAATGKPAPDALQITPREQVLLTSAWLAKQAQDAGAGVTPAKPDDTISRYAFAGGMGAAGMLPATAASAPAQAANVIRQGIVPAVVGQGVTDATGNPLAGAAASMAVPGVMQGATELTKRTFRGGEKGRQVVQGAIDDYKEIGDTPTVGRATGEGLRQGAENLSGSLLGGGKIKQALAATQAKMQKRLTDVADDVSTVRGDVEAGRVIQRGITGDGGFVDRFQQKSGQLWGAVDRKIGLGAQSDVANTKQVLDTLVRNDQFAKILNNPKLAQLKDVFGNTLGKTYTDPITLTTKTVDTIPFSTVKQLRTSVGEMLSGKELVSDVPMAQLKRLYAALSEDVRTVANQSGATAEFNRANSFTRAGHNRLDAFVERIATKVDLDKIYRDIERGGEGIQAINAVKRSLKPEEWEVVASNVIRGLGRAKPGQQNATGDAFSMNTFLTDWDKLGRAKNVLFSGSEKLNKYRQNLDTIARIAERNKGAEKYFSNPSGTGQFLTNVGAVSGAGSALATGNIGVFGTIMGGIASNKAFSTLMTSPKFVDWLAKGTKLSDKAWTGHISRLANVTAGMSEEERQTVSDLLSTLQGNSKQAQSQ